MCLGALLENVQSRAWAPAADRLLGRSVARADPPHGPSRVAGPKWDARAFSF